MAFELSEIKSFDLTAVENGRSIVLSDKTGKTGSFARAIAFASKSTREKLGQAMYLKWLANGNFRPVADDIVETIVPKSARMYLPQYVTQTGQVSRTGLINLCISVCNAVTESGKEPKGQKLFVYEIARRIAAEGQPETVEA